MAGQGTTLDQDQKAPAAQAKAHSDERATSLSKENPKFKGKGESSRGGRMNPRFKHPYPSGFLPPPVYMPPLGYPFQQPYAPPRQWHRKGDETEWPHQRHGARNRPSRDRETDDRESTRQDNPNNRNQDTRQPSRGKRPHQQGQR